MDKFSSDIKIRRSNTRSGASTSSLRPSEERVFGSAYSSSSYIVPTENEFLPARLSAAPSTTVPMNIFPKFDIMFEKIPKQERMEYLPRHGQMGRRGQKRSSGSIGFDGIQMIDGVGRLGGGGSSTTPKDCKLSRHIAITSECKINAPGTFLFQPCTDVHVVNVKLSDATSERDKLSRDHCNCRVEKKKTQLVKTRGTQTLYRESSAQTLPYLPDVSNDPKQLEDLEIFQLPTILPGDGPPGLYEVEVLERARKRWAFNRALKETFRRQIAANKENFNSRNVIIQQAFEWERWMEREEYIQECQMLRLDMVIRMFEAREKRMHQASKTRIELSMEAIAARREAGLRKNEIEFGRHMRRLEIQRRNQPRNWRKENIASQFGNPSSEFYAPQMRHGVNPSRRHFVADRKAFEERMDDLEKKAVNMKQLVCPFAKLKRWSKPKSRLIEVEQNFCSDSNLKNLYESLKNLRMKFTKQKIVPKCLIEKKPTTEHVSSASTPSVRSEESAQLNTHEEIDETALRDEAAEKAALEQKFQQQILETKHHRTLLVQESHTEELEAMLAEYEGSTIGWLMKFLADESLRLQEQRKLHYLTMLAQRERWRREAAEAGLRQKENDLREIYERLFHKTNDATIDVCKEYLQSSIDVDTKDYAEYKAVNNITKLAKTIDEDIKRWLDSFKSIQQPLNYDALRQLLKDLVFPNVNVLLQQYESELVVGSILEDVLFPEVDRLLEPIMISNDIASEVVDRLTDNDLYLFSDDSCASDKEECSVQEKEARAIIRKLIRYSVPGRRWMTPAERNTGECVSDILDNVFENVKVNEVKKKTEEAELLAATAPKLKKPRKYHSLNELRTQDSHIALNTTDFSTSREKLSVSDSIEAPSEVFIRTDKLGNYREIDETPPETIHRELSYTDSFHRIETEKMWEFFQCPYTKYGFEVPEWYQGYLDSKKDKTEIQDEPVEKASQSSEYSQLDTIFACDADLCEVPVPRSQSIRVHGIKYISSSSEEDRKASVEVEKVALPGKPSGEIIAGGIIKEVIKSFVRSESEEEETAGEDQSEEITDGIEEFVEEEFEDNAKGALKYLLRRVLECVSDGDSLEGDEEEEIMEEQLEEGEYLIVNESEIERLQSNRCKCKSELEREQFLRKMLEEGKVQIVKMPKELVEEAEQGEEEEEVDDDRKLEQAAHEVASVETFEFSDDEREAATSSYDFGDIDETGEEFGEEDMSEVDDQSERNVPIDIVEEAIVVPKGSQDVLEVIIEDAKLAADFVPVVEIPALIQTSAGTLVVTDTASATETPAAVETAVIDEIPASVETPAAVDTQGVVETAAVDETPADIETSPIAETGPTAEPSMSANFMQNGGGNVKNETEAAQELAGTDVEDAADN